MVVRGNAEMLSRHFSERLNIPSASVSPVLVQCVALSSQIGRR